MSFLAGLNDAQRRAVDHYEGPLLVIAGAGSAEAAIVKVFAQVCQLANKFDFAHRSDAVARLGSRELRAVKSPAYYDAWRSQKRRINDSENIRFSWVSEVSLSLFSVNFGGASQF